MIQIIQNQYSISVINMAIYGPAMLYKIKTKQIPVILKHLRII